MRVMRVKLHNDQSGSGYMDASNSWYDIVIDISCLV